MGEETYKSARKDGVFNKQCRGSWLSIQKQGEERNWIFAPDIKINPRWIRDLNAKSKGISHGQPKIHGH
jgi:hypothetical protein